MLSKFKLGICQTRISNNKLRTLEDVEDGLSMAVSKGAQMILLPECFNSHFDSDSLKLNAENFSDSVRKTPTLNFLRQYSRKFGVYLAGSIPEEQGNYYYNTGLLFDPCGQLVLKQRKIHLWNVDISGRIQYKEGNIFKAGNKISVVETALGRIGMGIGYDLRFGQQSQIMAYKKEAQLLLFPCNFSHITGQLHWDVLLKSRAIDNQCFVAGVNPAKLYQDPLKYQSYGHSAVIDPLGRIISQRLDQKE